MENMLDYIRKRGLMLVKVHRVLNYFDARYFAPYILLKTSMRLSANKDL